MLATATARRGPSDFQNRGRARGLRGCRSAGRLACRARALRAGHAADLLACRPSNWPFAHVINGLGGSVTMRRNGYYVKSLLSA